MYSLTFHVRVTTPPQYERNGTASLQTTSRTQAAGASIFSEAIARPSVCLSSVTLVHPTQAVEIFGNISTAFATLAIR